MSTGNWLMTPHPTHNAGNSMAAAVAVKTGVIQQLTCLNFLAVLSHIRRVCTPLDRVGRGSRPRQLHVTHYGYLCPVETPEGPACGLIKAFALGARITNIFRHLQSIIKETCTSLLSGYEVRAGEQKNYVFLNGDIIGDVGDADGYVHAVRRHCNADADREIHAMVTVFISPSNGHVYVYSDEGRVLRPLMSPDIFMLDHTSLSINNLIQRDAIQFIDAAEVSTLDVASNKAELLLLERKIDVVEIDPALMLGVTASFIPFIQYLWTFSFGFTTHTHPTLHSPTPHPHHGCWSTINYNSYSCHHLHPEY